MYHQRTGRYRMPVVFGPSPGPRQGPDGDGFDYSNAPRTVAAVSFLTDPGLLARYLPPNCALDGDPVVTVEHVHLRKLAWLAGRDYRLLQVKFPVVYAGGEHARGPFLPVLWENRPEPIITGREELGFAKLYCELPGSRRHREKCTWPAEWDGHEFARLSLWNLKEASPPSARGGIDGVIHHRYVPGLSDDNRADVDQMVLSPAGTPISYDMFQRGEWSVEFLRSTWEQLPTMSHIVNALADLPVLEVRDATLASTLGASDLSDQRVLR